MNTADQHEEFSEAEKRLFAQGRVGGRRGYRPMREGPEPEEAPDGAAGASGDSDDESSGSELSSNKGD